MKRAQTDGTPRVNPATGGTGTGNPATGSTRTGERAAGATPVVSASNVFASYDRAPVLVDLTFSLQPGQLIAIVGPNGAGKSTLFKLLTGIKRPDSGSLRVLGDSVHMSRRANRIAYVPQEADIDWDYPIFVRDVVMSGRFGRMRQDGFLRKFLPPRFAGAEHHRRVDEALEAVDMSSQAHRPIGGLSGGQKKRVFLARAIAQEADLLLLDEPLAGVDRVTESLFFEVLGNLIAKGKSVIMISHDLPTVQAKADTALLISRTVIEIGPPAQTMTQECMERAYHSVRRAQQ
ncbi:MAG: metal ABC transporter ATP-binding protein [Spirochaetia bacterium]